MRKVGKTILRFCKWMGIFLLCVIVVLLVTWLVGKTINGRTPDGGIN